MRTMQHGLHMVVGSKPIPSECTQTELQRYQQDMSEPFRHRQGHLAYQTHEFVGIEEVMKAGAPEQFVASCRLANRRLYSRSHRHLS